jgi:hypothetical protein
VRCINQSLYTCYCSQPCFSAHAWLTLSCRRGSSQSVILTFNSWRPYNEGALALRYTFETGRLDVLHLTPTSEVRHPTGMCMAHMNMPAYAHRPAVSDIGRKSQMSIPHMFRADLHLIDKNEGEYSIVTEPDGAVYEAFIDPKVRTSHTSNLSSRSPSNCNEADLTVMKRSCFTSLLFYFTE